MNNIEVFFEEIPALDINESMLVNKVNALIINELKKAGNICIVFCSDKYLLDINRQYLDHNYYTDIVTFDYVENSTISGDLFISIDRVKENAEKYNTSFVKELFRVVFHGILHIIGYNDKTEDEKMKMRQMENYYLSEVDFGGIEL